MAASRQRGHRCAALRAAGAAGDRDETLQPVPSANTADRVRTLSLSGYPDGICGHDPTDRSYYADLWMDGHTHRPAADVPDDRGHPEQLRDLIAEFTCHSRGTVRAAMAEDTPDRQRDTAEGGGRGW